MQHDKTFDPEIVEAAYDAHVGFQEMLGDVYGEGHTLALYSLDDSDLDYVRRRATRLAGKCIALAGMVDHMLSERKIAERQQD